MRHRIDPSEINKLRSNRRSNRIALRDFAPPNPERLSPSAAAILLRADSLAKTKASDAAYRRRFGRAISLDKIESALKATHVGSMMQLTDLSRETIETDPHLGSVLNKRFGAISSVPFEVRPVAGDGIDKQKALLYAAVVREQLENLAGFRDMLRQLAWALFDGRAAIELFWRYAGGIVGNSRKISRMAMRFTNWIHPRRLSFGPNRELVITSDSVSSTGVFANTGLVIDSAQPGKFVKWLPQLFCDYPEREGLSPRCMYWSFFKRYSQRDRMILLELFGKPWRIVEVSEESQASDEDLKAAEDAADGLGSAYTARMPRGAKLVVVQPGETAGQVHSSIIDDSDRQISKLVLGQTATTDGVPAGLNSNQAVVLRDEQSVVFISDALWLSEIIETQLTDKIISVNFGESELPHAPSFLLRFDLPSDRTKEIGRLSSALNTGLEIALAEAYEISGFRQPERTEAILRIDQPPTPPLSPTSPAPRSVIVWPSGSSPPAGEQQPVTPQASTGEGAREGAGVSVGAADQASILTVNEAREGQNLPPLTLPDGDPDPDGDLTIAEFTAKRGTESLAATPQMAGSVPAKTNPNLNLPELSLAALANRIRLMIRKEDGKWCVRSQDGNKNLGCYNTLEEANERLRQIEQLKHVDDLSAAGELAAIELARLNEFIRRATEHDTRQPFTENGSPESIIHAGALQAQTVLSKWSLQLVDAFRKFDSASRIAAAATVLIDQLDSGELASPMKSDLLQGAALGALDAVDDESGKISVPVRFAPVPTDPEFAAMPFDKAMRIFKDRAVVDKTTFDRMSEAARRKAFTVAALTKKHLLNVVHDELGRMISTGANFREFAPTFLARLESGGFVATEAATGAYVQTVFRTNVLGAYSAGRYARQTQPEVLKARPYWQIRTVTDDRRRANHGKADGLILRADDPLWQRAYSPFGFNCFLPGTCVEGRVMGGSRAFYLGTVIELITKSGRRVMVTANHPLLTDHGFVIAKALRLGDLLVCVADFKRASDSSTVESMFAALAQYGREKIVRCDPDNFHGDARSFDGPIDVVGSYCRFKHGISDATAIVIRSGKCADIEVTLNRESSDSIELCNQLLEQETVNVMLDPIIAVNKSRFLGRVYDLESPLGWVAVNGIYASNCRCRVVTLSEKQAANMVITDGSTIDYLPDPGFTSGVGALLSTMSWINHIRLGS